jgi:two-component system, LuxR family, sensor kinase FixL
MGSQYALALLEAATDAVIVIDHRGVIETVNAAAERLFGYSTAELVGSNVSLLIPAGERERHDEYLQQYVDTGVAHIIGRGREVEAQRSDGSRFPAGLSVGKIAGTNPPRFVGFLRDLTEYRRALATLQADRDRAREREAETLRSQARLLAVSRMATMGEMAAGIAHEINQPLTAISNYARACQRFAAKQPPNMEDLQDCMNEIANETQRAAEIIRELRHLVRSKLEERLPRDLNDIVRQTRPLILADARVHQTAVHFDTTAKLPRVSVEAVQIQQLLLNLTRNALESVEGRTDGKREIRITTSTTKDGDVELSVMDNGPGIDPTVEQQMFEPFVSTKPTGTGLGLAISRTIAQSHGGQLLVRPGDSGGAHFALRLPRCPEAASL